MKTMTRTIPSPEMPATEPRPTMNRSGGRRIVVCTTAIVVIGIAWYLFRPELLLVNKTVDESLPESTAAQSASNQARVPTILASGTFHKGAHDTEGKATIHQLANGERVLRLTGFKTSNGPDVHVFLVAADDVMENETVKSAGYVDLGSLKGNVGDQNYKIPHDVDLDEYRAATIWCARFGVNFGTAPLSEK